MVRQILPNNNEKCYSNFSKKNTSKHAVRVKKKVISRRVREHGLAASSRVSALAACARPGGLSQYTVLVSRPTFISCPFVRFTVIRCGNFVSGSRAGGGITTRHFISRAAGERTRSRWVNTYVLRRESPSPAAPASACMVKIGVRYSTWVYRIRSSSLVTSAGGTSMVKVRLVGCLSSLY
jgi:hypothetical protein